MKTKLQQLTTLFKGDDKVIHFLAGALVATLILVVTKEPWFGFAGALLIGGYKEFSDHLKGSGVGGVQTWYDWFATIAGGLIVELIW